MHEGGSNKYPSWIAPAVVAMMTAIVVLFVYLKPPSQNHYNPDYSVNSAEDSKSLVMLPPNIDPDNYKEKKYTEKDKEEWVRERSDLAAQWRMADIAFIGLWVGIIGIAFIAWTLIETRSAAESARQTLTLSRLALENASNATAAQLRPYLQLGDITINLPEADKDGVIRTEMTGELIDLRFSIINHGQTPARAVSIRVSLDFMVFDTENVADYETTYWGSCNDRTYYIGPNKGLHKAHMIFGLRDYDEVALAVLDFTSLVISADVEVIFEDAFSEKTRPQERTITAGFIEIVGTDHEPKRLISPVTLPLGNVLEITRQKNRDAQS